MYYMCKNCKQLQKKLQVGDKVKIISAEKRKSIIARGHSFMFGFIRDMVEFCGKEFVIKSKEVLDDYDYGDGTKPVSFRLKGAGVYTFSVEMFETQSTLLKNE